MCRPMIEDHCWCETRVRDLDDHHVITLLGRELHVDSCKAAPRGGDFVELDATDDDSEVHLTVDKNMTVLAKDDSL